MPIFNKSAKGREKEKMSECVNRNNSAIKIGQRNSANVKCVCLCVAHSSSIENVCNHLWDLTKTTQHSAAYLSAFE